MYVGNFNSFNEIIKDNFSMSENQFFEKWEDFTKELFF